MMNNSTTNILIIFPMDPCGQKVGGAETFIKTWIKASPKTMKIEFVGISSAQSGNFQKRWTNVCVGDRVIRFLPLFHIKDENKKPLFPLSLKFTWALIRSNIDLKDRVLLFNRIEPAIIFARKDNPKIVIIHSDIQQQHTKGQSEVLWRFFPRLYQKLESKIISSMDRVYTVSRETLSYLQRQYLGQSHKFKFINTSFDPDLFRPADKEKIFYKSKLCEKFPQLQSDRPWFLFVGRLQEAKAPHRLLEMAEQYVKRYERAALLIIGDGNLLPELKNMACDRFLQNHVFFLGALDPHELSKAYQACDLLVLTSYYEGMPLCVLEALASGIPVVSTDVGELNRIVVAGQTGELVVEYTPDRMVQTIQKVLDNRMGYSMKNCVQAVLPFAPDNAFHDIYQDALGLHQYHIQLQRKCRMCRVGIDNITMGDALNRISDFIKNKTKAVVVTPNVDHMMKLQIDSEFRNVYTKADLILADGMPLLWASRFLKRPLKEKISGSDLFPELCRMAADGSMSMFFLGGRPQAADRAKEILEKKYPGIRIAGTYCPPFGFENDPVENQKIIQHINQCRPDILFVGLGAPKQEKWICRHQSQYDAYVSIGIGVTFEFTAGMVRRAPVWMQRVGMEWFWRLMMEPRRLWKRYLVDDMRFFGLILKEKINLLRA
ncbi:MAG: WecB/TagA/CpsF family glycosyltransferase [Candidatus Omnitrophica bacterium]|nr:WecB/TagA/CpsF family glycosyltransferase [Candidatus Omnitrophota bacterium]